MADVAEQQESGKPGTAASPGREPPPNPPPPGFLEHPTRLEFWVEDAEAGATRVKLQVTSFVRGPLARPWTLLQRLFWSRFPRWLARSLGAQVVG